MQDGVNQPRIRVNRTIGVNLTNSWQDIVFNGTSTYNVNSFGIDTSSGNKMINYDSATNLFKFYNIYDTNYNLTLFLKITSTVVSTGTTIQYRFVIPNGNGAGQDVYFPFPDTDGYADLAGLALKIGAVNHTVAPLPLYLNNMIRTNGIKFQMRLDATLAIGTITLNNAAVLIQE